MGMLGGTRLRGSVTDRARGIVRCSAGRTGPWRGVDTRAHEHVRSPAPPPIGGDRRCDLGHRVAGVDSGRVDGARRARRGRGDRIARDGAGGPPSRPAPCGLPALLAGQRPGRCRAQDDPAGVQAQPCGDRGPCAPYDHAVGHSGATARPPAGARLDHRPHPAPRGRRWLELDVTREFRVPEQVDLGIVSPRGSRLRVAGSRAKVVAPRSHRDGGSGAGAVPAATVRARSGPP